MPNLIRQFVASSLFVLPTMLAAQAKPDARIDRLKTDLATAIDARAKMAQQMVDQVFSFGELGMQEIETSKYLTGILEQNGFKVERGVAGIPTAWVAKWGSGSPVIALGSDIDGIPQASQKPGVAGRARMINGAPAHGEGHNSGVPLNIIAALAVKDIMTREKIPGTIMLWPGVAEEQLGSKAFYVRAGMFNGVDANLFAHVSDEFGISYGDEPSLSLISAIFKFTGQSAHAAGAPWRGKSALDAVMNMANAWEYHREHMELAQRSHYVITDGGDQPNVVPSTAAIWFYFRERDYDRVSKMFEDGKQIARAAAQATFTTLDTVQVIGSAWRPHFNKPIAEAMHANAVRVGMPKWDDKDVAMAKAVQRMMGQPTAASRRRCRRSARPRKPRRRARVRAATTSVTSRGRCRQSPSTTVEHPGHAGSQLGRRDRHGDADRAQGRGRGREGPGDDAARPHDAAADRGRREALLQRSANKDGQVQTADGAERSTGHMVECGEDGAVPRRDAEVLLRPVQVRDVSRAARHYVPNDSAGAMTSGLGTGGLGTRPGRRSLRVELPGVPSPLSRCPQTRSHPCR
jgi:aminobenzoyl-glutamate utilization protein B